MSHWWKSYRKNIKSGTTLDYSRNNVKEYVHETIDLD
jgi:hypothetical protein